MKTLAPQCYGCSDQMSDEQEPWTAVQWMQDDDHNAKPAMQFFCPDCSWRIETFAENVKGTVINLPDNTPATVIGLIRGQR